MTCIICTESIEKNKNVSFCDTCSCDMCKDCVTNYILDYKNDKCPQCRCNINTEEIINLYDIRRDIREIRVEISSESNQDIVVYSPSGWHPCYLLCNRKIRTIIVYLTLYIFICIFTYNEILSFFIVMVWIVFFELF